MEFAHSPCGRHASGYCGHVPFREYLTRVFGWFALPQPRLPDPVAPLSGRGLATAPSPEDRPMPSPHGLHRVINEAEVSAIADELLASGAVQPTRADVAVAVTRHINELPGERDLELVRRCLEDRGFPPSWGDPAWDDDPSSRA